jgi:chemotaxis protein MotB
MEPHIIIKKKAQHGGHHGGAWKVAYADFVTAMMALFIVLWLMSSSKQVQEAIAGYFKDPKGTGKMVGSTLQGAGEALPLTKDDMPKLKEELENAIRKIANFDKLSKQIEMTVTAEGLRIDLLETETGTFFDLGSADPNANGKELLAALAVEIGKLPNKLSIEGHTDSRPYGSASYSNWELSVDRANAARRIMSESGLQAHQVAQVRGYADQNLRNKDNPEDPANRRISLIVQYLDPKQHDSQVESNSQPEAGGKAASAGGSTEEPSQQHSGI